MGRLRTLHQTLGIIGVKLNCEYLIWEKSLHRERALLVHCTCEPISQCGTVLCTIWAIVKGSFSWLFWRFLSLNHFYSFICAILSLILSCFVFLTCITKQNIFSCRKGFLFLFNVCLTSLLVCENYVASVIDEGMYWSFDRITLAGKHRSTRRKTCPSVTSFTTNPTRTVSGLNKGRIGEKHSAFRGCLSINFWF